MKPTVATNHDGGVLGVDGCELGVLEQLDWVGPSRLPAPPLSHPRQALGAGHGNVLGAVA